MSGERIGTDSLQPTLGVASNVLDKNNIRPEDEGVKFSRATTSPSKPEEEVKHISPGAKMIDIAKGFMDDILNSNFVREAKMQLIPMSAGSGEAKSAAQKFINNLRVAQNQWHQIDNYLTLKFSKSQREAMWNAADEQNVLMRQVLDTAGKGIDRLPPDQRQAMETMHKYAQELWGRAKDAGMVTGEGMPFWTPRMAVLIGDSGEFERPGSNGKQATSSGDGRNVSTTASSLKHAKYLTAAETEAAMKGALGDNATLVRDIRIMPLAMARLESAIAGRELVNQIREIGLVSGKETISSSKEWDGPLKAVMSTNDGAIYRAYMLLKSKAMTAIMVSPLTHQMVILGRALAYSPLKVLSLRAYFVGNALAKDNNLMRRAISAGMVPMGANRNSMIDITDVARGICKAGSWGDPNESWINLSAQKLGNVFKVGAGDSIKERMDKFGDYYHHDLLWKQVGALQIYIFNDYSNYLISKGHPQAGAQGFKRHAVFSLIQRGQYRGGERYRFRNACRTRRQDVRRRWQSGGR